MIWTNRTATRSPDHLPRTSGDVGKEEPYPLDAVVHADLIRRMRGVGQGQEWIFHSRKGTLLSLGNARRPHLHPVAMAIGVVVGGWHDFRPTTNRMMRRSWRGPGGQVGRDGA